MIHPVENEEVEIAKVAGDGEVDDLPATVRQSPIVAPPAANDQIDEIRGVAFADQVVPRPDGPGRSSAEAS
jgi:hypothetical protein